VNIEKNKLFSPVFFEKKVKKAKNLYFFKKIYGLLVSFFVYKANHESGNISKR